MSYIGNQPPDIGAYDVESFNGGGTSFTLKRAATVSSVLLFIDGVRQTPTDAYTVSGVTLTTTATTPSGTDNVTVMFMGDVVDIGAPSNDTVSTAKIQDDAVTAAKLANSINTEITANTAKTGITSGQATAITANTAKVTNATHTGDVTGATALTIATDAVDIAMLSATGTADATTFLRGDNAWASAGGANTPAFMAYPTGTAQTLPDNAYTKVNYNTEAYDTDDAYDHTTNYRFTVPAGEGGKYLFTYFADLNDGHLTHATSYLRVNNTSVTSVENDFSGSVHPVWGIPISIVLPLSAADYVEFFQYVNTSDGGTTMIQTQPAGYYQGWFSGHKLIGV